MLKRFALLPRATLVRTESNNVERITRILILDRFIHPYGTIDVICTLTWPMFSLKLAVKPSLPVVAAVVVTNVARSF